MKNRYNLIVGLMLAVLCACSNPEPRNATSTSFEELSKQGRILCRKGEYMEGLKLFQEANDALSAMHPDSINPDGAVMFLGNLSNLYNRVGLYEEAKQVNSRAIDIAEAYESSRLAELWGMRSVIYQSCEKYDSAAICLRKAAEMCETIKDEDFRKRVLKRQTENMAWLFIENPGFMPDSIPSAKATLERIDAESSAPGQQPYADCATNRFLIGRAYVLLGDFGKGLPLMEQSLKSFRERGDTESVEWALQILARSYAAAGDRKLFDIYTEASVFHDTIMRRKRDDILLGMDFKYRATQLADEKSILQNEVQSKRDKIIFISIISLLVVASLVAFIIMRHRNNRRQISLKQQNIDTLLAERIALNARIEELNRTIADSNSENLRHEMLQTILLEREDEVRFRKSFNDLHPGFIDRLRSEYPDLSSGNELLCMLIALNRRNEEIALAMGISRESVATSRYRLRRRFNLSKDTDLNNFIQSRLRI